MDFTFNPNNVLINPLATMQEGNAELEQQVQLAQQQAALAQQQAAEQIAAQNAQYQAMLQPLTNPLMTQQQTDDTPQSLTGNPLADSIINGMADDKGRSLSSDNASYFNRKILDDALALEAKKNNWTPARLEVERKKTQGAIEAALGNNQLFNVKDRGITGLITDTASIAADSIVGGLAELGAGAYALVEGRVSDNHSGGHALLNAVDNARKAWRGATLSDEAKDTEKARSQAKGAVEMLDVMIDNPSGAIDVLTYGLGQVFGGKGIGAIARGAGKGLAKSGVKQALRVGDDVLEAGGQLGKAADTLRGAKPLLTNSANVLEDVSQAAAKTMISSNSALFGVRRAYNTAMGTAKAGAGNALIAAGNRASRLSPLGQAAVLEGASAHNDVLRVDGAFNPDTNQFTDDALNTALGAGALAGGITYGAGKIGNTFEGALHRSITGQGSRLASRAESSTLAKLVSNGAATSDDAVRAVAADVGANTTAKGMKESIEAVADFINTPTARKQLAAAVNSKSAIGKALSGTGLVTSSMLHEGAEEGLIGLVSSVATQAINGDGTFDWDKVDWREAVNAASSAAALGAMMGVAGAGVEVHNRRNAIRNEADTILQEHTQPPTPQAPIEATEAVPQNPLTQTIQAPPIEAVPLDNVLLQQQAANLAAGQQNAATAYAELRGIKSDSNPNGLPAAVYEDYQDLGRLYDLENLDSVQYQGTNPQLTATIQAMRERLGGDMAIEQLVNPMRADTGMQDTPIVAVPPRSAEAFQLRNLHDTLRVPAGSPILAEIKSLQLPERHLVVRLVDAADAGVDWQDNLALVGVPEVKAAAEEVHSKMGMGDEVLQTVDLYREYIPAVWEARGTPTDPNGGGKGKAAPQLTGVKTVAAPPADIDRNLFHLSKHTTIDGGAKYTDTALAEMRDTYHKWIEDVTGRVDDVVFVSPNNPNVPTGKHGFVFKNDPSRVYVVLNPNRTKEDVVWTVMHERLHNGVTAKYRVHQKENAPVIEKVAVTPEAYRAKMEELYSNATVKQLVEAMSGMYGHLDLLTRTEEAIAELAAARATKNYARIKHDWGVDVPMAMRTKSPTGLISKAVNFFKEIMRTLKGNKRRMITDGEVAAFLRSMLNFDRVQTGMFRTPTEAAQVAASLSVEASLERSAYYRNAARNTYANFDTLPLVEQHQILAHEAKRQGDDDTARELSPYDVGKARDDKAIWTEAARERVAEEADKAMLAAASRNARANGGVTQALPDLLHSARIYPLRGDGADYDPMQDVMAGYITHINGDGTVSVVINRQDGTQIRKDFPQDPQLPYQDTWDKAVDWIHDTYPMQYGVAGGIKLHQSLYIASANNPDPALRMYDVAVLNDVDRAMARNPLLQKLARHLMRYMPDNWLPVMDKVIDMLDGMIVHWVDIDAPAKAVQRAFQSATGKTDDIIGQWLTDKARGDAFMFRRTDAYGDIKNEAASYADARDYTMHLVRTAEHFTPAQLEKMLAGLETYLRDPELLARYGENIDGTMQLIDPANYRRRMNSTGFSFDTMQNVAEGKGGLDFGAMRFINAVSQFSPEQRIEFGRIAASIAHTNRVVMQRQADHGTLLANKHTALEQRGRDELAAVFPELADTDFGGFYLSMKDEESNPFQSGEVRGRHTLPDNLLETWQKVQAANIRKAHANKEWGRFIAMVSVTPNEHFTVEPASPKQTADGETEWVFENKGKYTMSAIVNGIPVRLVATSKQAEKMLQRKQPSEFAHAMGLINGWLSPLKTAFNLSYVPVGVIRDILTGFANIQGAIGSQWLPDNDAARVGSNAVKYALQLAPNTFVSTYKDTGRSAWLQAMEQNGGGIFFGDRINTGTYRADVASKRAVNPLVEDVLHKSGNALKAFSYTPEVGMRLGAFRAYMEYIFPELSGNPSLAHIQSVMDNPANRAAVAAVIQATKNVTTNFQQHGADNLVRFVMPFHNATLQGTFGVLPQTLSTAHGRKTYGILLTASVIAAIAAIGSDDEDEFGESKYFSATGRERKIIIGDTAIPINDELSIAKVAMDNVAGIVLGKRKLLNAVMDIMGVSVDSITSGEMGKSGNFAKDAMFAIVPPAASGLVAIATGNDIFGNPLQKKAIYDSTGKRISNAANFELSTGSASGLGQDTAETLYGFTNGLVDMSGNHVDQLGQSILGGVYNLFKRSYDNTQTDGATGLLGTPFEMAASGFTTHRISKEGRRELDELKERLGVSTRNAGTSLDVLNVGTEADGKHAMAEVKRWERRINATPSPRGYTHEQLRRMIAEAEANGDGATLRDLREERKLMYEAQEQTRREMFDGLKLKGLL